MDWMGWVMAVVCLGLSTIFAVASLGYGWAVQLGLFA